MANNAPNRTTSFYAAFDVVNEGARLLNHMERNNGRKLRRFVSRNAGCLENTIVFTQQFTYENGYSKVQLAAIEAYARKVHSTNIPMFPERMKFSFMDTIRDDMFGIVSNSYIVAMNVKTASVAELRDIVKVIYVLNEEVLPFLNNTNNTALMDCPDYVYRGLACTHAPWAIGGIDREGSGVLEWCYDEVDAKQRLALMEAHPDRFKNLNICSPKSMQPG